MSVIFFATRIKDSKRFKDFYATKVVSSDGLFENVFLFSKNDIRDISLEECYEVIYKIFGICKEYIKDIEINDYAILFNHRSDGVDTGKWYYNALVGYTSKSEFIYKNVVKSKKIYYTRSCKYMQNLAAIYDDKFNLLDFEKSQGSITCYIVLKEDYL